MPRSLAKPLVPTQVGCCVATRTSRQFLTARIQQCYGKLRRLEPEIFFQMHQLEFIVSQQHFASVECHKEEVQTKFSTVSKERQKKLSSESGGGNEKGSTGEKGTAEENQNESFQCYGGAHITLSG